MAKKSTLSSLAQITLWQRVRLATCELQQIAAVAAEFDSTDSVTAIESELRRGTSAILERSEAALDDVRLTAQALKSYLAGDGLLPRIYEPAFRMFDRSVDELLTLLRPAGRLQAAIAQAVVHPFVGESAVRPLVAEAKVKSADDNKSRSIIPQMTNRHA